MNYGLWMSAAGLSTEVHRQDIIANNVANAETASADLIRRRDRGHYTHALEKGSDPVSQHG